MCSYKSFYTNVHVSIYIIHNSQRPSKLRNVHQLITEEQNVLVSMKWNIIQPQKRNEVLIHATTWMSFEQITLSGRSQTNNSLYMKCPEQANQLVTGSNEWCQRLGGDEILGSVFRDGVSVLELYTVDP